MFLITLGIKHKLFLQSNFSNENIRLIIPKRSILLININRIHVLKLIRKR